jgi:hypothetical protein
MKEKQMIMKRENSGPNSSGFKVIKVEISTSVESLYAVCTPVNLK